MYDGILPCIYAISHILMRIHKKKKKKRKKKEEEEEGRSAFLSFDRPSPFPFSLPAQPAAFSPPRRCPKTPERPCASSSAASLTPPDFLAPDRAAALAPEWPYASSPAALLTPPGLHAPGRAASRAQTEPSPSKSKLTLPSLSLSPT